MFQNNSLVSVGVQVKDIPVVGFELVSGLRCQHTAKQNSIACAQILSCLHQHWLVIQNKSQPKPIIILSHLVVEFLIESVIEQDHLIFSFLALPEQNIAAMGVSMHETILMNHLDNNLRECPAHLFGIDASFFYRFEFIDMHSMDELHDQQFLSCGYHNPRHEDILELLSFEHLGNSLDVSLFQSEVEFPVDVVVELFNQPAKSEIIKQELGYFHETMHQFQVVLHILSQMRMLYFNCHLFPIFQHRSMDLSDGGRRYGFREELQEGFIEWFTQLSLYNLFDLLEWADFASSREGHHPMTILVRYYNIQGCNQLSQLYIDPSAFPQALLEILACLPVFGMDILVSKFVDVGHLRAGLNHIKHMANRLEGAGVVRIRDEEAGSCCSSDSSESQSPAVHNTVVQSNIMIRQRQSVTTQFYLLFV